MMTAAVNIPTPLISTTWKGLASHPVSSIGTEAVMPGLSVGRKGRWSKAEDVELRNSQQAGRCMGRAEDNTGSSNNGELE